MLQPLDSVSTTAVSPFVREAERPAPPQAALQVTVSSGGQGGDAAHGRNPRQHGPSFDNALAEVNHGLQAWATGLRFDIDPDAQRLVVSIVDTHTGEVLRTVPSDAVIRIAKMIVQLQGTHVDTQA